jgi:hypothetical protein
MATKNHITHATRTSNLADVLERVLDKGVVIAGDIKIKLVDIELLTIQIRLVVCSVERAQAMGMNWWQSDPNLTIPRATAPELRPSPSAAECLPPPQASALPLSMMTAGELRAPAPTDQRIFDLEQTVRRLERQLAAQPQ